MLTGLWSQQPPYQFLDSTDGLNHANGLDIALVQAIVQEAGLGADFRFAELGESLEALSQGAADFLPGAYLTEERGRRFLVSEPYRFSEDRLFLGADVAEPDGETPAEVISAALEGGLRLAVPADFEWGAELSTLLRQGEQRGLVLLVENAQAAVAAVQRGRADAFLGDRLTGLALSAAMGEAITSIHPVVLQRRAVHILFSPRSVSEQTVERFDAALDTLRERGELARISRQWTNPIAVSVALDGAWFDTLILIGLVAFSISGVVLARSGGYSVYGALVLASLPALGGGVVRDMLMLREVYLFQEPRLLTICLAIIALGYLFNRFLDLVRGRALWFFDLVHLILRLRQRVSPGLLLQVFDSLGLAAFTVVAVSVAAEEGLEPLWLWGPVTAAITATGGAILRDMIRKESINPFLHTSFYGEAALIWAFVLSLYLDLAGASASPAAVRLAIIATMLGLFATRLVFVVRRIHSPRY